MITLNMKSLLPKIIALILWSFSLTAVSQSIDTTKYYTITNMVVGEGKAITGVVNATLGNTVTLRSVIQHPMQQWIMEQGKYGYRIYCREYGRGFSLEVINDGGKGIKVSLGKTVEGAINQVWRVSNNLDGSYRIVSLWQEKGIDYIKTGDQMYKLTLTEIESSIKSQTWRLVGTAKPQPPKPAEVYTAPVNTSIPVMDTSAVYKLTCQFRGTGFAMDAVNDESGNIKPMLRAAASSKSQQWKFKFYNREGGLYRLINTQYTNRSLDIVNDGKPNPGLSLAVTGDYSGQYWRVVKNADNSVWFISYWQRDKAVDVVNAGNKDELIMNTSNRYTGQLWMLTQETPAAAEVEAQTIIEEISNKDKLMPGEQLKENQKLISANGEYSLVQQADGNLVIYNASQEAMWASGMSGNNVKRTVMQHDGSLTQHPNGYDLVIWSTQTDGNKGAFALLQNDGALVIVNSNNKTVWQSKAAQAPKSSAPANDKLVPDQELAQEAKINSANGNFSLVFQQDGNLVLYDQKNSPLWSSGTNGQKASRCVMQKDGNFVIYNIFKEAIWSSNTYGYENSILVLHDNGNLVLYSTDGSILWHTNTGEK